MRTAIVKKYINQEGKRPMSLWAIVPVKPLRRAKSRLSDVLSGEEREKLNHDMLKKTLQALSMVSEIGKVLVVSSDMSALALAREYNARTLLEDGHSKLNTALTRATTLALAYGTSGVLVLPADLPLINSKDIQTFLDLRKQPPGIVIAPDRHGISTNALMMNPTGVIQYTFGANSYQRHISQAHKAGAHVEVCNLLAFALDIDTPLDLALYRQLTADFNHPAGETAETLSFLEAK
jgi:2-phospho-L-lactate/phosphoenolpyruvate guanylyltransferase